MKHFTTTLIIISLSYGLHAQEKGNHIKRTGISSSASILEHTVRGHIEPYISMGSDKKQAILAPTILFTSNMGFRSPQSPRFTGARIGYRYHPISLDKKWGFNISVDLRAQRLKDTWDTNSYNQELMVYEQFKVKTIELLIENYIGYGLEFKIGKSLSLSQGVGLGWYVSNLDAKAPATNRSLSDLVDYRGYDDFGFIWNVRLEVSYQF